jgi:hypothetical protein
MLVKVHSYDPESKGIADCRCQCIYLSLSAYSPAARQEEATCQSDGILDRDCSRVFQHWQL